MKNRLKDLNWLIITSIYGTAFYGVEYYYSMFTNMAKDDLSYICYVIWGVFVLGVFLAGLRQIKRVSSLAGHCTVLGLLGSVAGIIWTFSDLDLTNLNAQDQDAVKTMMNSVATGLSTSLNTTYTGIVAGLGLEGYVFILGNHKEKRCDK